MERREKVELLLEQMRLCLAKQDYIRAQIISRKISVRFFEDEANQVGAELLRFLLGAKFVLVGPEDEVLSVNDPTGRAR